MVLLFKQARAIIDGRTTVVCLDIHGVSVEPEAPFETIAGDFLAPPFHIHCRTLVAPFMRGFVSEARRESNAELMKRPKSQRRRGPNGELGSEVPGPVEWNLPTGFSSDYAVPYDIGVYQPMALAGDRGRDWLSGEGAVDVVLDAVARPDADEALAVEAYVGSGYTSTNQIMRGQLTDAQIEARYGANLPKIMRRIELIDRVIEKQRPLGRDIVLYRAVTEMPLGPESVGTVLKDLAFQSTAIVQKNAQHFMIGDDPVLLEIRVPAGTKVAAVNLLDDPGREWTTGNIVRDESEILLARGTKYRVISFEETRIDGYGIGNKMIVEVIP